MRIWDIPVRVLCRNHLLGEHRELHAIWNIILLDRKGYSRHPEVLRWHGKLGALYLRHEEQVREMSSRGYEHSSPLDLSVVPHRHGHMSQEKLLDDPTRQIEMLKSKGCGCRKD